jgi:hypothetical protein
MTSYGSQKVLLHMTSSFTAVVIISIVITILINKLIFKNISKLKYLILLILALSFSVKMKAQEAKTLIFHNLDGTKEYTVFDSKTGVIYQKYNAFSNWGGVYEKQSTVIVGILRSSKVHKNFTISDLTTGLQTDSTVTMLVDDLYLGINITIDTAYQLIDDLQIPYKRHKAAFRLGSLNNIYDGYWDIYPGVSSYYTGFPDNSGVLTVKTHDVEDGRIYILYNTLQVVENIVVNFTSVEVNKKYYIETQYSIEFDRKEFLVCSRKIANFFR